MRRSSAMRHPLMSTTSACSAASASIATSVRAKPVRSAPTSRFSWTCRWTPTGAAIRGTRAEVFESTRQRALLKRPGRARSSSKSLAATYCINDGIPNDGNTEGDDEGRSGSKRHSGEMQGEQSQAKSGKSGNGVRQHGCRGRTANAAMQNEHNAGVDDREHGKHAASRRANLKA